MLPWLGSWWSWPWCLCCSHFRRPGGERSCLISTCWTTSPSHIRFSKSEGTAVVNVLNHWLVVYLPLWKIWKSIGMIIPNIWKIISVPNHQPEIISESTKQRVLNIQTVFECYCTKCVQNSTCYHVRKGTPNPSENCTALSLCRVNMF